MLPGPSSSSTLDQLAADDQEQGHFSFGTTRHSIGSVEKMTLTSLKSLELRSLGLAREREAELPSRLPDNPVVLSLFRSGTIGAVAL